MYLSSNIVICVLCATDARELDFAHVVRSSSIFRFSPFFFNLIFSLFRNQFLTEHFKREWCNEGAHHRYRWCCVVIHSTLPLLIYLHFHNSYIFLLWFCLSLLFCFLLSFKYLFYFLLFVRFWKFEFTPCVYLVCAIYIVHHCLCSWNNRYFNAIFVQIKDKSITPVFYMQFKTKILFCFHLLCVYPLFLLLLFGLEFALIIGSEQFPSV